MPNEIKFTHTPGRTVYVHGWNDSNAIWSVVGGSFVSYSEANWADYAIVLTEAGSNSRFYTGDWTPSSNRALYFLLFYEQIGGAPSSTDDLHLRNRPFEWSGTGEAASLPGNAALILECVNEMLEDSGLPPAIALDTGGSSDVADAERILARENQKIQERGWAWNQLTDETIEPDAGDGDKIKLSAYGNVIRIVPIGLSRGRRLAWRDGIIYDLDDNTDAFSQNVELEITELISFDEIPHNARRYICKRASVEFQRYIKRGRLDDAFLQEELEEAHAAAMQENGDIRQTNVLESPESRRLKGNRTRHVFANPTFEF